MPTTPHALPQRIQLHRTRGWKKPPNTVVVARPTKWGNPFPVGKTSPYDFVPDRETSVGFYRRWIKTPEGKETARAAKLELAGKNLACWCPLGGPCHGDVLLEIANG